jgi:hypothetical protein
MLPARCPASEAAADRQSDRSRPSSDPRRRVDGVAGNPGR